MKLNKKQQKFLLQIARKTLEEYLFSKNKLEISKKDIENQLIDRAATFVTLTINNELRGCIGNILPKQPLYIDVINNSLSAAFADPRFPALEVKDIDKVKIEISILSKPKRINYDDVTDLLKKIKPKIHGVIIQSNFHQATFLPQVWNELEKKEDFLTNLALKAGLSPNAWKDPEIEFFCYTVESFSE